MSIASGLPHKCRDDAEWKRVEPSMQQMLAEASASGHCEVIYRFSKSKVVHFVQNDAQGLDGELRSSISKKETKALPKAYARMARTDLESIKPCFKAAENKRYIPLMAALLREGTLPSAKRRLPHPCL